MSKSFKSLGVIESNGQIIRNESGLERHREFKGQYVSAKLSASDRATVQADTPEKMDWVPWILLLIVISCIVIFWYWWRWDALGAR